MLPSPSLVLCTWDLGFHIRVCAWVWVSACLCNVLLRVLVCGMSSLWCHQWDVARSSFCPRHSSRANTKGVKGAHHPLLQRLHTGIPAVHGTLARVGPGPRPAAVTTRRDRHHRTGRATAATAGLCAPRHHDLRGWTGIASGRAMHPDPAVATEMVVAGRAVAAAQDLGSASLLPCSSEATGVPTGTGVTCNQSLCPHRPSDSFVPEI